MAKNTWWGTCAHPSYVEWHSFRNGIGKIYGIEWRNFSVSFNRMSNSNEKIILSILYGFIFFFSPEYSLFVGDITDDVDDLQLYNTFARRYKSCQAAKGLFFYDFHFQKIFAACCNWFPDKRIHFYPSLWIKKRNRQLSLRSTSKLWVPNETFPCSKVPVCFLFCGWSKRTKRQIYLRV